MDGKIEIANSIILDKPITFLKFGDGEYAASNFWRGNNCDNDRYTLKLGFSLRESFKYQVYNNNNCLMGAWHESENKKYWESLVNSNEVKWVDYHIFVFDNHDLEDKNKFSEKINLYKIIKNCKRKKIYICNELMVKAKILLDIDYLIFVPLSNWFDNSLENVIQNIIEIIGEEDGKHMVLTSCGMGAKVVLTELYKKYPNGIYLDIGSALDLICTKKNSRGYYSYDTFYNNFLENDFIPNGWDSPEYDYIYPIAQQNLGLHL